MATLQQIQAKGETLARALAEVQKEIAVTRANLEAAAGTLRVRPEQSAEKIAGRLLVLEVREKSITGAIEGNAREATRQAELLKSGEYKDVQKKVAELEAYFTREADEVFNELTLSEQ